MAMVSRLLSTRARERPDSPAFLSGADERVLTWREVAAHAARRRHEIPPGSRVGLVIADPLLFTAAYLGCLSAGVTVAPVDPRLTDAELADALARLRIDVLATDRDDPTVHSGLNTVLADFAGPRRIRSANTPHRTGPSHPAVLLTSSGTTGAPKGIPLTEWQLLHAAGRVARPHRFGAGERGYTPHGTSTRRSSSTSSASGPSSPAATTTASRSTSSATSWSAICPTTSPRKRRVLAGPAVRFEGTAEQHRTIALADPSNNVIEFKNYDDPRLQY